jgi:hypothetical protein
MIPIIDLITGLNGRGYLDGYLIKPEDQTNDFYFEGMVAVIPGEGIGNCFK